MNKKIFLILFGSGGSIFSLVALFYWGRILLGSAGAIAPNLSIEQELRSDKVFDRSLNMSLLFLVLIIISLIIFIKGIKYKGRRK